MKATQQYFPVVLFITLYKVVLTFESVDKILWCDHLNESWWEVLPHGTVYYWAFNKMKFGFFCRIFHLVALGDWKGSPKSTVQRTKLGPFVQKKISRSLHKTRMPRINCTKSPATFTNHSTDGYVGGGKQGVLYWAIRLRVVPIFPQG